SSSTSQAGEQERDAAVLDIGPLLVDACRRNDAMAARSLLQEGAPSNATDLKTGWTALDWAAHNGDVALVQALLRAGASAAYHRRGATASATAPLSPRGPIVQPPMLPSLPARATPLHWAAYQGSLRVTWVLLQDGYSSNDVDEVGNAPAHLAATNGHDRVLETLLADGADPTARNCFGNAPADVAATKACRALLARAAAA
ncbi:unnamed protein product, partial [Phaeothamnion confervicola]